MRLCLQATKEKGLLSFNKAVEICHEYEHTGVLCSISGAHDGIELFTAVDATTCSHVMSKLNYDYCMTEELLRELISMCFCDIRRRITTAST